MWLATWIFWPLFSVLSQFSHALIAWPWWGQVNVRKSSSSIEEALKNRKNFRQVTLSRLNFACSSSIAAPLNQTWMMNNGSNHCAFFVTNAWRFYTFPNGNVGHYGESTMTPLTIYSDPVGFVTDIWSGSSQTAFDSFCLYVRFKLIEVGSLVHYDRKKRRALRISGCKKRCGN